MYSVNILTAQNVHLHYETASVGDRILATLIDFAVFMVYGAFYTLFISLSGIEATTIHFLMLLPLLLYHLLFEIFYNGQSLGKMSRKIKVAKLDGTKPGVSAYLLRWLFRLIEIPVGFGGLALLVILTNGKGQRLGDIVAGTTVVKLKDQMQLEDTSYISVEENYVPVFPQVLQLSDRDLRIVKDLLDKSLLPNNEFIIAPLAAKIKTLIGVETTWSDYKFLFTILKDYTYLSRDRK